jgi:hypothetical protein
MISLLLAGVPHHEIDHISSGHILSVKASVACTIKFYNRKVRFSFERTLRS